MNKNTTASKELCFKTWTSYGIGTNLLPYLETIEQIQLQCLNQFSYNILVSRVKTLLALPIDKSVFYFTCWSVKKYASTVIRLEMSSQKASQNDIALTKIQNPELLNFTDIYTVQVGGDLYGFKQNATPARLNFYPAIMSESANAEDAARRHPIIEKAQPRTPRKWPSFVNFCDKALFVSGGWDPNDINNFHASVERYDLSKGVWCSAPRLNVPRMNHSSCVLGYSHIYAFFGRNKTRYEQSIEKLDARAVCINSSRKVVSWQLIQINSTQIPARQDMLVAPISPSQIAIFGGYRSRKLNDRYVFNVIENTDNEKCTYSVSKKRGAGKNWSKKLTSVGNICLMTKWGEFAAIVLDDSDLNYCLTYRKEKDQGVFERLSNINAVPEQQVQNQ